MNKPIKRSVIIYSGIVIISIVYMLCDYFIFAPQIKTTYTYPLWTLVNLFVVRPMFWFSVAVLTMKIFFRFIITKAEIKGGKVFALGSILLLVAYVVLYIIRKSNDMIMYAFLWLTASPVIFVIPGFLMALGTQKADNE